MLLLYVNDLHHPSKASNPIIFADDSILLFSHNDINVLSKKMDKDLMILSNCFNASKLSLNGKITVSAPSGQLY